MKNQTERWKQVFLILLEKSKSISKILNQSMKSTYFWPSCLSFIVAMAIIAFSVHSYFGKSPSVAASDESTITTSTNSTPLENKLKAVLQDPKLVGSIPGVTVRKADSGDVVFTNFGDIRLRPASNMKLLTGASAMEVLGQDYRFSTEVLTDGQVKGNVLHGNLYMKGKGDPTLMKEDLDHFARSLKEKGIQKIQGDIIADDSWYDNVRYSQDLNWSDEHNHTGAQVSALTLSPNADFDTGTVIVEVNAGAKVGESSQVMVTPSTDYVEIVNNAKTVGKGATKNITIEREHGTNRIIIDGNIPLEGVKTRSWIAVWEPAGLVLDVFVKSLSEQGIQIIGNGKKKIGVSPTNATTFVSKDSMPLSELFVPFMKLSNNGHAEILVKEMGKVKQNDGSWDAGLRVMKEKLKEFGVNTDTVVLRDGSGMSHKNLVSADELSTLLYKIQGKSWFQAFKTSLPVAGEPDRLVGGSLRNRMGKASTKGNVIAKTGSITGVSTLSGYVTAKDGTPLIFSIMINNFAEGSVTPIEDAIATVLAEHEFKK